MRSLIEELREMAVRKAIGTPKMREIWRVWVGAINETTGGLGSVEGVLDLGSHLREIFQTTTTRERSQGAVSIAGRAWEGLVCWYLNLCMIGTRCVAMKHAKAIVPDSITDAMTVSYGNTRVTSEADLVVLTFPDFPRYTGPLAEEQTGNRMLEYMNENVRGDFASMGLGIIQCKTNWNDSAQIPMLWNMIYSSQGFADQQIAVGINNRSIRHLRRFSYSFVTLPSQSNIKTDPGALHVARVRTLSGLNYWGMESVNNAVESLREIFDRNFGDGIDGGVRANLERQLPDIHSDYGYFLDPVQDRTQTL